MELDGQEFQRRSRMDSNDEGSGRARKRVSRACDRCRVKKDKCDALKPQCSPCIANNVECSYDPGTKKRGLPEGYVRKMEQLWALSIMKVNGLEDTLYQIMNEEQHVRLMCHETSGEALHTRWKQSGVLKGLESMLSGPDHDVGSGRKRKRDDEDEEENSATPDVQLDSVQPAFQILPVTGHMAPPNMTTETNSNHAPPFAVPHTASHVFDRGRVSLPNATSSMLDHYFAYTHCWLPIVERHEVMRTWYEHAKGQKRATDADLAVLWAILAYAAQQLDHESLQIAPAEVLGTARNLIPDESGPFELGHVQGLVLITLLHIGLGQWPKAWILIGIASRAGLQLRLEDSSTGKRARLGATLQACCILDTLVAGHLTLRPHLRRSDLRAIDYLEEDGSEDWEPWRPTGATPGSSLEPAFTNGCFNRFFDTVMIINDVMTCDEEQEMNRSNFLEGRNSALDVLESKYPAVSPDGLILPHHLMLRIFRISAVLSILKSSAELGGSIDRLARTAWDVLALLSQQSRAPALAFRNIAPIFEIPLRAASDAAISSRVQLAAISDMPSYADFANSITTLLVKFSSSWPVFSPLASLLQSDSLRNGNSLHIKDGVPMTNFAGPLDGWPAQANITSRVVAESSSWVASNNYFPDVIDPRLSRDESFRAMSLNVSQPNQDGMDLAIARMGPSTPAGLIMPAVTEASPSIYGDEVDAIFHNLVHLDTTDWTDNRQKGLADFGFADEDAFQAFCNDPERLLATNGMAQAGFKASTEEWPPPGLFPGHFTDTTDAQMEASQILQSLSGQTQSDVDASSRVTWWS